ncbi:MAG TPA: 50S ribosomal protein L28 [Polyangia bacterium]|nr:50S ribosomal protein L28 [Polyangia bacterium]
MAAICEVCGKRRNVAHSVSHSNIKTKRVQRPNLQRVRALVEGRARHIRVCTRCLRSGKVLKAPTTRAQA